MDGSQLSNKQHEEPRPIERRAGVKKLCQNVIHRHDMTPQPTPNLPELTPGRRCEKRRQRYMLEAGNGSAWQGWRRVGWDGIMMTQAIGKLLFGR